MTIYEKVAKQHNTTPDEVKREMQEALSTAGIDMDPELFVALAAKQVLLNANKENPHA